ncbi:hypothetical protein MTP99_000680 [Tenebrio molitor]|nr:hypothetical protein MTP99_000680 [Tenebrio molitor]
MGAINHDRLKTDHADDILLFCTTQIVTLPTHNRRRIEDAPRSAPSRVIYGRWSYDQDVLPGDHETDSPVKSELIGRSTRWLREIHFTARRNVNEGDCVIREDRKRWYQWDESTSAEIGGTSRECDMIKKKIEDWYFVRNR